MKKFILAISIVCLLGPLSIAQAQPKVTKVDDIEVTRVDNIVTEEEKIICKEFYKVAAAIMTFRQSGMPAFKLMEQVKGFDTFINNKALSPLVQSAYEVPRYMEQAKIDYVVSEFANGAYLGAYELAENHIYSLVRDENGEIVAFTELGE